MGKSLEVISCNYQEHGQIKYACMSSRTPCTLTDVQYGVLVYRSTYHTCLVCPGNYQDVV